MLSFFLLSITALAAPDLSDRLQLTELSGPKELKVLRAAGAREVFLGVGEMLFVGDELRTLKGQIAGLMAYDGAKWKIAPDSRFKVERRKPEKQSYFSWGFQLLQGAMWGFVPHSEDSKDAIKLRVRTKNAALGIRGTEYLLESDEKRSAVDVLEGVVWFGKSAEFAPGSYQEVSAGQRAELGASGRVELSRSRGDKAALAAAYGLSAEANEKQEKERRNRGTAEECRARGKAWKSEGSQLGECVD